MARMKKEFETRECLPYKPNCEGVLVIAAGAKKTFIVFHKKDYKGEYRAMMFLNGKSLETFAVNILKALKSKKLKHGN